MSTFEDFLRGCLDSGHTQVRLVPRYTEDGSVAFYAHGQCGPTSGETFKCWVAGDYLGTEEEVAGLAPEAAPVWEAPEEGENAGTGEVIAE